MDFGCAGDRDDPRLLSQNPRERNLRRRRVLLLREAAYRVNQGLVRLPVLRRETRNHAAEIGFVELRVLIDRAGKESLTQRAEGNKADSEFFERGQNLSFGFSPPERIFALQRGNRLNFVRAADG